MISIIIASVNKAQLEAISENIAATIGVPYEIIATDNSGGKQGLCAVYNQAAKKARYDILCFMHEDIIIKTEKWGEIVASIFTQNAGLGLLGVVGGSYKSLMPSGWFCYGAERILHFHILQSFKRTTKPTQHEYSNFNNETLTRVASVDGVWFCTTKQVVSEIAFNEELLTGFHGYDIDFSIAVNQKYEAAVTYDVLLEHLSEGHFDHTWLADTLKLHRKWKAVLPLNIAGLSEKESRIVEWRTFKVFLSQLVKFNLSPFKYRDVFLKDTAGRLGLKLWLKMYYYILKNSL